MCGICGILNFNGQPVNPETIKSMAGMLSHRGPDEEGFFISNPHSSSQSKIGLGFRRLSIIDLANGHQPMQYQELTLVFNGEIYNFKELKKECVNLEHTFLTQSDTEVLLHLFSEINEKALEKLNGMFAFALWNNKTNELLLARDRIGIKPLYYFLDSKKIVFSSELKSLLACGQVPFELDSRALQDFFSFRFVPAPYTLLKNVRKLIPGHFLTFKEGKIKDQAYWNLNAALDPLKKDEETFENELFDLLNESVKLQMQSDVPLGAFLSGGVDSSLITALMVKNSAKKIKTFSIGFEKGTGVDESKYARTVAKILGTEHHELFLTENDLAQAEKYLSKMNEPVADPTILPTALLSRFAREEVKVTLTGEGGDELFAGYNRYKALLLSEWILKSPKFFQKPFSFIAKKFGKGQAFQTIPWITPLNWFDLNQDFSSEIIESLFENSESSQKNSGYLKMLTPSLLNHQNPQLLNEILKLESSTALPERLLMKVDMASMSESLEARPPYLDHRIVELAWKIPSSQKIKFFKGKYILRKIATRFLPRSIAWRKKHGFILPLAHWVRSFKKDFIQTSLEDSIFDSNPIFNKKTIQNLKNSMSQTQSDEQIALAWPMIVLSLWSKSLKKS
ncbi:MAG: asparagine synthase (glutamine-hydrolyzing) [Elusimicrobia bacterium RIFCSPLOWO2_02_FULL_39_32]|nr:MAG: asparagine synthase (glutamine-hydrolyzing) [Elusimicrobia bacterium RIFCSPHIGHO2_02_FULL_39_36]OGR92943.1 MAG: asparagine synthase (glutamine-hydrolyzing) [Elusimicrobia bacterium RIFCSPLOWO2_02_FULL_39_32]OGR99726.1 MAG: asparagine synthase (glutamine-hydrolyzing) [Elusimicrobia bacterium RIFCSPLOWO2_12_FULL_39_28]